MNSTSLKLAFVFAKSDALSVISVLPSSVRFAVELMSTAGASKLFTSYKVASGAKAAERAAEIAADAGKVAAKLKTAEAAVFAAVAAASADAV